MSSHLRLVAATAPRLSPTAADFEPSEKARRRFISRAISWAGSAALVLERLGSVNVTAEPTERGVELHAASSSARFDLAIEKKHLDLSLELDGAALEKLAVALDAEPLMRALAALPDQFVVRRGTIEARASKMERDELRAWTEEARRANGSLRIGWRVPRNLVLSHARVLDERLVDALRALCFVEGAIAGRTRSVQAAIGASSRRVPAPLSTRARLATAGTTRLRLRGSFGRPRIEVASTPTIDRGSRVRVLAGPFEGRVGVVHALDARAARVFFGLLATRVDLGDLAPAHLGSGGRSPAKRPRPAIATSHRRSP